MSKNKGHETPAKDKLSNGQMIAYGLGGIVNNLLGSVIGFMSIVLTIGLGVNPENNTLKAIVTGLEGKEWTPVPNTEVRLSALRYFGSLTLDVPKLSDSDGEVEFQLPEDLPGDKDGFVDLSAQLTDIELFGEISTDYRYNFGVHTDAPSLTENRAMWNSVSKAPLWLLFAFPGAVLTVWSLIFFVLFQIRKIYRQGEE